MSTNDLLVAGWAKATRAQLLEMPINLRNRYAMILNLGPGLLAVPLALTPTLTPNLTLTLALT